VSENTSLIDTVTESVQALGPETFLLIAIIGFGGWALYKIILHLATVLTRQTGKLMKNYETRIAEEHARIHELEKSLEDCRKRTLILQVEKAEAEGRAQALAKALDESRLRGGK